MTITMHALASETFAHGLEIARGALGARLAPDMYPRTKRIQLACHHATDATSRLTGAPAVHAAHEEVLSFAVR